MSQLKLEGKAKCSDVRREQSGAVGSTIVSGGTQDHILNHDLISKLRRGQGYLPEKELAKHGNVLGLPRLCPRHHRCVVKVSVRRCDTRLLHLGS